MLLTFYGIVVKTWYAHINNYDIVLPDTSITNAILWEKYFAINCKRGNITEKISMAPEQGRQVKS